MSTRDESPGPDRSRGDAPGPDAAGGDPHLAATEEVAAKESATAARLFDIRRIIGGLFVVYGAILTLLGLLDGADAEQKAQGIDINLWTGLTMLAVGVTFLAWMALRPLSATPGDGGGDGDGPDGGNGPAR